MERASSQTSGSVNSSADEPSRETKKGKLRKKWWQRLIPTFVWNAFLRFDRKLDGAISFFLKHYGKTRFMIAMSKKVQYLGLENVFRKGPKAFVYFFLFYLIRDTILYIIIPIFFARLID